MSTLSVEVGLSNTDTSGGITNDLTISKASYYRFLQASTQMWISTQVSPFIPINLLHWQRRRLLIDFQNPKVPPKSSALQPALTSLIAVKLVYSPSLMVLCDCRHSAEVRLAGHIQYGTV